MASSFYPGGQMSSMSGAETSYSEAVKKTPGEEATIVAKLANKRKKRLGP